MKYSKMLFLALLLFVSFGLRAQNKKSGYPNLNGKWVSKADPHYTLRIANGYIYETYLPGRQVDTFRYEISEKSCWPKETAKRKTLYLQKKQKGDEYCYKILSYSANAFSMVYEDKGNIYTFIRYLKHA
jgi:hypothetical protein